MVTEQERFGRELEEDHDLLTFNESAARLRQEIGDARAVVAGLPEDDPSVATVRLRLEALLASQARIEAQAQQDVEGRRFANYRPQRP